MKIKSIRFKMALWYVGVLALTLTIFSFIIYKNLQIKLNSDFDTALRIKAEGIVNSINAYWDAEKMEAMKNGAEEELFIKINNLNFDRIVRRWVQENNEDASIRENLVQIFNSKGKMIASTGEFVTISPPAKSTMAAALNGSIQYDYAWFEFIPIFKEYRFRRITLPAFEENRIAYIVRIASSTDSVDHTLKELQFGLLVLLPLMIIFTGLVGDLLVRGTLRPIDKMINTIHRITAENLELRIPDPKTNDEIQRLSDTFNQMLSRLENAFTYERHFIEDLTHELKTPLAVLKGELEVTMRKKRTPEEYESMMQSNLEEINRIIVMVEKLLLLARFDNRAITFNMEPVHLLPLLDELIEEMKILAANKNINLHLDVKNDATVNGDPEKLRHLLQNIIDNAIKYTDGGGNVSVVISATKKYGRVEISDTGKGMEKEEVATIFERFSRLNGAEANKGFGLGLSIAKTIAEAHNGSIRVSSEINKGSQFVVSIPLWA